MVLVDAFLHGGVVGQERHLLEAGAERAQAADVRAARIGVAEVDDLARRETLLRRAGAIEVVIHEAAAARLVLRRHVLAWQRPDLARHAQAVEHEIPVRRPVYLLVERGEFPQIERVMLRVYLFQQREQRMVEDLLDLLGLGEARRQRRHRAELAFGGRRQRLGQALGRCLAGVRRHVELWRKAGTDAGVQ